MEGKIHDELIDQYEAEMEAQEALEALEALEAEAEAEDDMDDE